MENGILLPTLQSALPFLDLHGTPRLEFHQSVFDELREKLMERVATIAEGKEEDRWIEALIWNFDITYPIINHTFSSAKFTQVRKAGGTTWEKLSIGEDAIHTAGCHASAEASAEGTDICSYFLPVLPGFCDPVIAKSSNCCEIQMSLQLVKRFYRLFS